MLFRKKYRLLPQRNVELPNGMFAFLHRIVALVDIPEHDVMKGDLGGYVSGHNSLSHKGSCWIAGNAIVISRALGKKRISVNGRAYIGGKAYIEDSLIEPPGIYHPGDIIVASNVSIIDSDITGSFLAKGDVRITDSTIVGNNFFEGGVRLNEVSLSGANHLSGDIDLPRGFVGKNLKITSKDELRKIVKPKLDKKPTKAASKLPNPISSKAEEPYRSAILETLAEYESYTTDIVKLLKYPMMADGSIPEIRDLIVASRKARRELKAVSSVESLKVVANELEYAFATAENKALTIATSHLDQKAQESLRDASQRFAIACDTGATDNERKLGFKAGMKSLEGIIHVSEDAIDAFKMKTGLLELEA